MISARTLNRSCRAFTLLELLIALAVAAVVLSAISGVFYSGLRLRNRSVAVLDDGLPVQHVTTIIQRDLENIMVPGGVLSGQLTSGQATAGPTTGSTSSTTTSPGSSGGMAGTPQPDTTEFFVSTGALDDNSPFGDVQKVTYQLVSSTNNQAVGKDLVRMVTRNLLPVSTDMQVTNQWLMGGVQKITFTYYDGTTWQPTWDTSNADPTLGITNVLPQGIKVQIELAPDDNGGTKAPIELVVPIFPQSRTNNASQLTGTGS